MRHLSVNILVDVFVFFGLVFLRAEAQLLIWMQIHNKLSYTGIEWYIVMLHKGCGPIGVQNVPVELRCQSCIHS